MTFWSALVLLWSLRAHDAGGTRFITPIPVEGAIAIADRCPWEGWTMCVGILLAIASRESGYNEHAVHDHGKGYGAFGVLNSYPHHGWFEQVDSAWKLVLVSQTATEHGGCTEALELYASGRCGNEYARKISRWRMALAYEIVGVTP